MKRERAKELLPVIQAFAEGKKIECYDTKINEWRELEDPFFTTPYTYRIKPESLYRHFNSYQECWNEMLKHEPFGWIKNGSTYINIVSVANDEDAIEVSPESEMDGDTPVLHREFINLYDTLKYTFADGTPFGIKEE